ncbi:S8 family serine peptidase [Pseudomonas sp. ISL-88]|uniref:S8 family peptidase n=1 Tax=Bacteria TaxID=2 RepID=UPI001BEC790C|nr:MULTISPECIES: S8 family peptidase [Bacteria]MBT2634072.1 S8 family serine peptidase [Bacillus sp. ISL-26]MBT2713639.1 S8 family serine peptidase [Pseudomonas sp. ISL-88]
MMHFSLKTAAALTLCFSLFSAAPLVRAETPEQDIIVVYKNQNGKESAIDSGADVEQAYKHLPAVAMSADSQTVKELRHDPDILYVEDNVSFQAAGGSDMHLLSTAASRYSELSQWDLAPIQVKQAWKEGLTGRNVKVAVIDSGIFPHDDLSIAGGYAAVTYTSSYKDDNGHGTHVAGIIAAQHDGYGVDGIAPGVRLYAVKALDQKGSGDLKSLLKAIDWSIANKMDIINMSLGTNGDSQILHEAVDKAYQKGIVIVAAAGNDGNKKPVNYPAAYSSVTAVSAANEKNQLAAFSTAGKQIEFSAPGTNITSTYLNQLYAIADGTSQAAPHVTGMFALLKQKYPQETNAQLRKQMQQNVKDLGSPGRDNQFGYGLIQYHTNQKDFAEQAVIKAERTKKQTDINQAKKEVNKLPKSKKKSALEARINKAQAARNVTDAKDKVKTAEKQKKKTAVDAAESAIRKLPAGSEKKALQKRLDAVNSGLLKSAKTAVTKAEKKTDDANTANAQKAVSELQRGIDKTALQKRLDRVKDKLNHKKTVQARAKVKTAEKYKTKKTKSQAQTAVNQLKPSAEKTKLQKRVRAIRVKH